MSAEYVDSRKFVYRFLSLPHHVRVGIAQMLGLLTYDDEGLQDQELFKLMFRRAQDRGLLGPLWDAVSLHWEDLHGD